jgi:hypothetical protein
MIPPAITLAVKGDGSVDPYMPETITFRDGERLRPVAPFFELWAELEDGDGQLIEKAVTLDLLNELRSSTKEVRYTITVANRKAERRTGSASCAFIAEASVSGAYPPLFWPAVRAIRISPVMILRIPSHSAVPGDRWRAARSTMLICRCSRPVHAGARARLRAAARR